MTIPNLAWPPYVSIPREHRQKLIWPNGARVAFWVAVNVELYELNPPPNPVRTPWPRPAPDILNASWRDYGNQSGIWRCFDVFDQYNIVSSVSLNSAMCSHFPHIVRAFCERGWELFSHGVYNTRYLCGVTADEERRLIQESCRQIEDFSGKKVRGFLSPGLTYSTYTLDILELCGIEYVLDLFNEDVPYFLSERYGKMLSIPYSRELNDIFLLGIDGITAQQFVRRFKDQFDQIYEESEKSAKVVSLPLHPYIIGAPAYIWALDEILEYVSGFDDVWLTSASGIADQFIAQCAPEGS